ncbi:MAG: DUF6779 domain-containing protein [Mycobacterium sp.]
MSVLTRGGRSRRSSRRPGWLLLTVLLVLTIAASSALVFTNRVELLKLALILALWTAVVAAFVSVIYRRQSDMDQAKVRDLKLVYDLQLDREISARREYELTVESHLRHELASELRAQAADEVAALRAELTALRANLEMLFDTDLGHRPAIETERTTVRAYSDWARDSETTGRVSSSRIDTEDHEDLDARTEESPIIDVPAEPHPPEPELAQVGYGGSHRRPSETEPQDQRPIADEPLDRRHIADEPQSPEPPPPPAQPSSWPEPEREPAPAEGQWIPAGTPGSNWVLPAEETAEENGSAEDTGGRRDAPEPAMSVPSPEPPPGRHSAPPHAMDPGRPAPTPPTLATPPAQPPPPPSWEPVAARHRGPNEPQDANGQHAGGQSVAELLARLQAAPTGGGGRRRREE